jgi:hypothetical protein
MKKRVVHCQSGEPFDVYIGRPSRWGNPFSHKTGTLAKFKVATREAAVSKFREWIVQQPDLMAALPELKGKVLGCWCWPLACHGDVLVELADSDVVSGSSSNQESPVGEVAGYSPASPAERPNSDRENKA